jgi:hypothetical protein
VEWKFVRMCEAKRYAFNVYSHAPSNIIRRGAPRRAVATANAAGLIVVDETLYAGSMSAKGLKGKVCAKAFKIEPEDNASKRPARR